MAHSVLPYERLLDIDARLEHAAARPVIVPDTIVIDHGSVFVSAAFRSACRHLGISIQPAHLGSGAEKGHIERYFGSVASLFCQFASGYAGRSPDRRGRHVEDQPLWSMAELQELLDEWLIAFWINRRHDGLRDPEHPGRAFTPNEKYAALVEAAGYVPVALGPDDYIELLPASWRAVNAYGIKLARRSYDSEELNPLRLQPSGIREKKNLHEIRHDPYDVSRIHVRGPDGWITVFWKHLDRAPLPFGELAWDHARRSLGSDATEEQIANAVAALLRRANAGPDKQEKPKMSKRDRRVAARTKAAGPAGDQDQPGPHVPAEPGIAGPGRGRAAGEGHPDEDLRPVRRSGQALVTATDSHEEPGMGAAGEGSARQLTTLRGWREFAADRPAVPDLLPEPAWKLLDDDARLDYDEARLAHHARLLTVATSTIQQVITEGRRLQYLNRHADAGRCGLILSGPARTGKTTCLAQLGKTIETMHHRRNPHAAGHIPVIYITAPPAATPRMIAVEFARFLGLPLTRRSNVTDVLEAVCGVCLDAATTLVCVDEIHNISLGTRHGAEASDTLKYFAERLPVTFAYAGINVERAGLLSGTRGEQIAGRFSMIRTGPFGRGQQWQSLIAALEDSLRLHRHRDGTLVGLSSYLHSRSGGMIGSLLRLIRAAAIQAVLDGTEAITKATLESIPVDIASAGGHLPG